MLRHAAAVAVPGISAVPSSVASHHNRGPEMQLVLPATN